MSTQQENNFQSIIAHAKEYGFVFPSSEIYDGLSAVYDYGPYGSELKKNIRDYWWKSMTQLNENIVGIDAAIFMHPTTWKASGHVDSFSDPMIDNKDSKKRYRVDHLIEDRISSLMEKAVTDAKKAGFKVKHEDGFLDSPMSIEEEQKLQNFLNTYPDYAKGRELFAKFEKAISKDDFSELKKLIDDYEIKCSLSGASNWTDIRQFNLMFKTEFGAVASDNPNDNIVYLRPETAQGIFVNFLNVQKTARMKIPFGIAQTGKAFRNEIVARQFIFRMREFEQMEMQFFVRPGTELEWYEKWKEARMNWHLSLGTPKEKLRFHDHIKLAHYANAAVDIEFDFPFGFKELEGIHSRTDYDLKRHQEFSGKKQTYFDTEINQHYIPYVVETSIGLDRMFLSVLSNSYEDETIQKEDGTSDSRVVLHINPKIAPVKLAIFPLTKKDGLPEIAKEILDDCKQDFRCFYEEKDAIGKRYRRQDAIGTPFCITIDHQTKEDKTVTIRHRDSMQQERISIDDIKAKIKSAI